MVMICYTAFMMMCFLVSSTLKFNELRKPDEAQHLFDDYYDDDLKRAKAAAAVLSAFLKMIGVLALIVLSINLANPFLKGAITGLAVINIVTIFFTGTVFRRDLYCKRWYITLTTAYALVKFAVVVWTFIYRLGEIF